MRLDDRPEPLSDAAALLVEAVALGVCGTDREIIEGAYGSSPTGSDRLVLGHESLGRVLSTPPASSFAAGDLVVGIVRHPDPVPCAACAEGEWDMCRNGRYIEHGIKALDGFAAERFHLDPKFAVKVAPSLGLCGVLLEPASVLAKAWEHIDRVGGRTRSWRPRSVLVTGAGPVGLLAALMARQRGLDLHVFDRNRAGPKPGLVRALGGTHHAIDIPDDLAPDIVIECTGAPAVVVDMLSRTSSAGIVCLTGISSPGQALPFDAGAFNRSMVLRNDLVFGSVNANRRHYELAERSLAMADPDWLAGLITRRVPLARWHEAFERRSGDVKVVLTFDGDGP
ncbi:MAG: glucose 1-dehydrogenase [Enhydrobacter sp.]|nr:MAG: glucose 1-dehydrogenase [Enhydrobacter sp.]